MEIYDNCLKILYLALIALYEPFNNGLFEAYIIYDCARKSSWFFAVSHYQKYEFARKKSGYVMTFKTIQVFYVNNYK